MNYPPHENMSISSDVETLTNDSCSLVTPDSHYEPSDIVEASQGSSVISTPYVEGVSKMMGLPNDSTLLSSAVVYNDAKNIAGEQEQGKASVVGVPVLVNNQVLMDNTRVIMPTSQSLNPADINQEIIKTEPYLEESQIYQANTTSSADEILNSQFFVPGVSQDGGGNQLVMLTQAALPQNQVLSAGQQFYIQGDQIISVPSSSAKSSTSFPAHIVQSTPALHGIQSSQPTRLILHTAPTDTISQPTTTNSGPYLIQVRNSLISNSHPQAITVNDKGHIVIRSNSSVIKSVPEQSDSQLLTNNQNVFRVVIPEGTTKNPAAASAAIIPTVSDNVNKHVAINFNNRGGTHGTVRNLVTPSKVTKVPEKYEETPTLISETRRLYECQNCKNKFMRPQYLKSHMKTCKRYKKEDEPEKSPIFMCSFCKATFKTRGQVNVHFTHCSHNPHVKVGIIKRKSADSLEGPAKKGKVVEIDPILEQAVQFRCQDCDRTFNKERQYTSHIKRCTKVSVHDMSVARQEYDYEVEEITHSREDEEDPFADPPPSRRGRSTGRRGRPPSKANVNVPLQSAKTLFDGSLPPPSTEGLVVADNEGLVRSTTGLAHTVQLTLETANQEGETLPTALVADSKGVRGRGNPPQVWSLVCSLCQKMFLTKPALANHMMTEHGSELLELRHTLKGSSESSKPLFRCPLCDHYYDSSRLFLEHIVLLHTYKLQEMYQSLHSETASFVCCLCSLVLLTKNLLLEHLSEHHLDELESLARKETHVSVDTLSKKRRNYLQRLKEKNDFSTSDMKKEDNEPIECGFCGEEIPSQEEMVQHYIESHGVETDEDGCLVDLGIDVDIRIKDTDRLLQLANGSVNGHVPQKTVLLRKKPRDSWQCKNCQHVFFRQIEWLKHEREVCRTNSHSSKPAMLKDAPLKCHEPSCSHLSFNQIKPLFKHMEEVHKIVVPRERRLFKSFSDFNHWLSNEEKTLNVKYLCHTAHIEKNNMKVIQMVCQRFHSGRSDGSGEEKSEAAGPPMKTKKKWFVRIQRSTNCHARIHLRVQFNEATQDYNGETQMVYYPQHTHTEDFCSPGEAKMIADNPGSSSDPRGDFKRQNQKAVEGELRLEKSEVQSEGTVMAQYMKEFCQTQLEKEGLDAAEQMDVEASPLGQVGLSTSSFNACLAPSAITASSAPSGLGRVMEYNQVLMPGELKGQAGSLLTECQPAGVTPDDDSKLVDVRQDVEPPGDKSPEKFVLPADDSDWTKLFDCLKARLGTGMTEFEQKEANELLRYQNDFSCISLLEQSRLFRRLCSITNTVLETTE